MSYSKRNKLERICEIRCITLEHIRRGATQKWVYDHAIYLRFLIPISTFYNYLGVPTRKKLSKLKPPVESQLSLF